jgi:N-methylhydantoinase A
MSASPRSRPRNPGQNNDFGGENGAFLGVDIGGTFTDVVLSDGDGAVHVRKVLTTPDDPRRAVRRGIEEVLAQAGTPAAAVTRVVHGTTLATNLILQRTGATVGFVTTAGFGDMLRLGREARVEGDRYDLFFTKPEPPVPHRLTFEVNERIAADGTVVRPLSEPSVAGVVAGLAEQGPEAVAICLLNSHAENRHERRLVAACREALPGAYVVASCEVWPEWREFDRAMTTVMSAYVGPALADYLTGLSSELAAIGLRCPVDVMESSGGVIRAELAARRPVFTVESGGAAGVTAAGAIGRSVGHDDVISFDMGGTTAKAGVVRAGRPDITHDFQVGGKGSYGSIRSGTGVPVKIPVVDLAEVGAGGGSIAWVDPGGSLRIGPRSAGSVPGPACYGRGGTEPTVTDANLVLGYLDPAAGLADGVTLSVGAACDAISRVVAGPLGLSVEGAAWAIHELVTANMAAAIRVVTVQRGIDPRDFALVAFGGAGPLHAVRLADTFSIGTVVVPWAAGAASAAGLCAADLTVHQVRSLRAPLDDVEPRVLAEAFADLEAQGRAALDTGEPDARFAVERMVGARHRGQAHQLTVDVPDAPPDAPLDVAALGGIAGAFRSEYQRAFGVALDTPIELVTVQARVSRLVDKLDFARVGPAPTGAGRTDGDARRALAGEREAWFPPGGTTPAAVYDWPLLGPGAGLAGPAIVQGPDTTVVIPPGRTATVDAHRNLVVRGDGALNGS